MEERFRVLSVAQNSQSVRLSPLNLATDLVPRTSKIFSKNPRQIPTKAAAHSNRNAAPCPPASSNSVP